ncbi:hypothetical protein [Streptomyces sp. NPDC060065]|uniref:hypothetical protein n=1 Tax=Streptomyces sp. NPDC060065 TaxID=3347050 RepID=UPI0036B38CC3
MPPNDVRRAIGYTLIIPPGWTKIPLRDGTQEVVKKIVDDAAQRISSEVPKDKLVDARLELHRRLYESVSQARRRDGVDLYLPVEPLHGRIAAASFIVAKVNTDFKDGVTPQDVLSHLVTDFDFAEPVDVHSMRGVRGERVIDANPEKGVDTPSRHVDYILPVPTIQQQSEWIVVSFSTIGDGNPKGEFSDLLVELFDAVMTTFRWRTE